MAKCLSGETWATMSRAILKESCAELHRPACPGPSTRPLYQEEWRMKKKRLRGPQLWAQPFWLLAKWAFKQVSTVAKI
jgi:hypothetical protein